MVNCTAISATKANRLYWLGRYTERVYLTLHILRKYYDKMIDGELKDYEAFYQKLEAINNYPSLDEFRLGQMYDHKNPGSVMSSLVMANDNGIVLREEIASETLSYIQLSLVSLQKSAADKEQNITNLQPITDYMLAFWGSAEERILNRDTHSILKIGKLVEQLDFYLRFDYPLKRIEEVYYALTFYCDLQKNCFDLHLLHALDEMISEKVYIKNKDEYKNMLIKYINQLILL